MVGNISYYSGSIKHVMNNFVMYTQTHYTTKYNQFIISYIGTVDNSINIDFHLSHNNL